MSLHRDILRVKVYSVSKFLWLETRREYFSREQSYGAFVRKRRNTVEKFFQTLFIGRNMGSIDAGRIRSAYRREPIGDVREIPRIRFRKIFGIDLFYYSVRGSKMQPESYRSGIADCVNRVRNTCARIMYGRALRVCVLLKISIRDFHSNERSVYTCRPRRGVSNFMQIAGPSSWEKERRTALRR